MKSFELLDNKQELLNQVLSLIQYAMQLGRPVTRRMHHAEALLEIIKQAIPQDKRTLLSPIASTEDKVTALINIEIYSNHLRKLPEKHDYAGDDESTRLIRCISDVVVHTLPFIYDPSHLFVFVAYQDDVCMLNAYGTHCDPATNELLKHDRFGYGESPDYTTLNSLVDAVMLYQVFVDYPEFHHKYPETAKMLNSNPWLAECALVEVESGGAEFNAIQLRRVGVQTALGNLFNTDMLDQINRHFGGNNSDEEHEIFAAEGVLLSGRFNTAELHNCITNGERYIKIDWES